MRKMALMLGVVVALAGSADAAVLYNQNFDGLSAADWITTGTDNVNPELSTIGWSLHSIKNWAYHNLYRYVEDSGGGDMVVRYNNVMSYAWGGITHKAMLVSQVAPGWEDVSVSGYVKWSQNARGPDSGGQVDWFNVGLVVRGDASSGTSAVNTWTGSFYFVSLFDDYPAGTDGMKAFRVNSGSDTELTGTVTWKNGYTDLNDAARRAGYLRVTTVTEVASVQINALFSTDPTFSDSAQEIVAASWSDSDASRITGGGAAGFAFYGREDSHLDSNVNYTWDNLTVSDLTAVPEPATMSLLAMGGLALAGGAMRRRRRG